MSYNKEQIVVLSIFPLSFELKEQLTLQLAQSPIFLLVSELLDRSPLTVWHNLRKITAKKLILAVPHPNIRLYLPLLKILSLPIKAQTIWSLEADGSLLIHSKISVFCAMPMLTLQTLLFFGSYLKSRTEIAGLIKTKPMNFSLNSSNSILYMDAT
ncbi:MAG: hypothetical protein JSR33_09275, partial [Proteobacteria bacterium]|nr:hypothetical protein [Pseudomonadota bacterium]